MPNCSKNVNDMLLAYVFKLNPIKPHGVYPDMYMYQSRRFSSFRGRQNYIFTLRVEGQPEHWELAAYSRVVPLALGISPTGKSRRRNGIGLLEMLMSVA